ncbi:MAG TPA: hypothetical protein VNX21_02655 [Candidatus Thermoplasmatota archaeon]|nr:hypothetical protein [Candidatus Thermoplasmatota archaeon]
MTPAAALLLAGNLALAAAMLATWPTRVGEARWHDDLAYATLVLAAAASVRLLRRRRVTTLLLASAGAWSALTGLWLVYATPWVGHGRWMTWWHGVTSVAFALAFLAHWARNSPRLVDLARRLAARRAALAATLGAWAALALLAVASWRAPLRAVFDDRYFAHVSTLALGLAAVLALYAGLVLTSRAVRPRLQDPAFRGPLRGAVDVSLLATAWLVTLTGLPLLYLARPLRAADAYWPVACWHVVTGALLLGLVAVHVGFNARPLRAHVRTRGFL